MRENSTSYIRCSIFRVLLPLGIYNNRKNYDNPDPNDQQVIKDRRWKEVVLAFSFPTTMTSASFVLRKYYMALVYHFEQLYYFGRRVPSYSLPGKASLFYGIFLYVMFFLIEG